MSEPSTPMGDILIGIGCMVIVAGLIAWALGLIG